MGEEGDWLTMDGGKLRLKQQIIAPTDGLPLEDNETAVTTNRSCADWTNPYYHCPRHPHSCHKLGECALFNKQQILQRCPFTFDPAPFTNEQDQHWMAKDPQAKLLWLHIFSGIAA